MRKGSRRSETNTGSNAAATRSRQHLRGGIHVRSQLDSAFREVYESRRIILIVASIHPVKAGPVEKFIPGDEEHRDAIGVLVSKISPGIPQLPTWTLKRMRAFFVFASLSSRIVR